jgi:hypothetical protein
MNVCVGKLEAEVCGDKLHNLQVPEIKVLDAIMKITNKYSELPSQNIVCLHEELFEQVL